LEGTETGEGFYNALRPFWSPDSEQLAYSQNGELRRISVDGGESALICSVDGTFHGGSWSPDGNTILYSSGKGPEKILYEVPSRGGVPEVVKTSQKGEMGFLRDPYYLPLNRPDRPYLFVAGLPPNCRIFLGNVATDDVEPLGISGQLPVYAPSGHVLYQNLTSGGDLWAIPFSLNDLTARENPFPIVGHNFVASVSNDGTLVYADPPPKARAYQLRWVDRSGRRLETIGRPQSIILQPELSPDGAKVAVAGVEDSSDNVDIWVHEVDRPIKRRLTFDAAPEHHPRWSPDGREIVFRSMRHGAGDLFVVAANAPGEERPFVESEPHEAEGDWSPDGRFFIYQVRTKENPRDNLRYVVRQEGGERFESAPFLERPFSDVYPQFSPDGKFVAYASDESGVLQVYVRPFPEGRDVWHVSESGGNQPRWSADGRELYWVTRSTLMAAEVSTRGGFIVGRIETLFEDPNLEGTSFRYDVASDGRFVTVEVVASGDQAEIPTRAIRVVENWYEEFRGREQN
jgi:Tol biopolymer transport system component